MNYEFRYEGEFLIIELSGTALPNERLLARRQLLSQLERSSDKVIVRFPQKTAKDSVSTIGILNTIMKEVHIRGGEMAVCTLDPRWHDYFRENRLDQVFTMRHTVQQAKESLTVRSYGT